ncbi:MAG: RNA-directed DNA polymerase [Xenococcaceae cyanobacterium MO_167.B27]|nr:RNA-directed DNA polymerase [Xenococcaceae cyanobacterium MO_167.B27]
MDHIELLNQVKDKVNIELAFQYAITDRIKNDSYFDWFEIEYVKKFKDKIINEIAKELYNSEKLCTRPAYTYHYPKNDLCYRRMIYIPFKDLVARYSFAIVLAEHLDQTLSQRCFANRRAKGKQANNYLLEDYFNVSLKNFRDWQKKCADNDKYNVLIKTDISSFYDSISHQYLIQNLSEQLSMNVDTEFFKLFNKLLSMPIISYSNKDNKVQKMKTLKQGLTIGNNLEGFFANLYLKEIDTVMEDAHIEFGRYNDDIRIFAPDVKIARKYLLILQENLLSKCLNLNASKTRIAQNKDNIDRLIRELNNDLPSSIINYSWNDEDFKDKEDKTELHYHIDKEKNKEDLLSEFNPVNEIQNDKNAKIFCQLIQHHLPIEERNPEDIKKIESILTNWQGSSKQASWLLVESMFKEKVQAHTKSQAFESWFNILKNDNSLAYTKYRLLHHVVNYRKNKQELEYRLVEKFEECKKEELKQILLDLLKQPAFELNIVSLYALKLLGYSADDIIQFAHNYIPQPLGEPIHNTILYIKRLYPKD